MNLVRRLTVEIWGDGKGDVVTFDLRDVAEYQEYRPAAHYPESVASGEDDMEAHLANGTWVTLRFRDKQKKGVREVDLLLLYPQG